MIGYWWNFIRYSILYRYTWKRVLNIFALYFSIIGVIWSFTEMYDYFILTDTSRSIFKSFVYNNFIWFNSIVVLASIIAFGKRPLIRHQLKGTDLTITIGFFDLFKQKGSFIIPVMDTFDNDCSNDLVNPKTIHGQFVKNYFDNNIGQLDREISNSLKQNNQELIGTEANLPGNNNRYEIGSTACIQNGDKIFYLSALSKMTERRNVEIRPEFIVNFLSNLWVFIVEYGTYTDEINIPVIGTGIKRLPAQFTNQDILYEVVNSFISSAKSNSPCKTLRICLYYRDFDKYDLDKIKRHLDHENDYERKF